MTAEEERVRNMTLTPEQYQEFESIRHDMSIFIQSFPDLDGTVESANMVYASRKHRKLESLMAIYCKKENIGIMRTWCFKYYNV